LITDMKAVVVRAFGPFDEADYCDVDDPTPGRGELVVDIVASEVNFPDILLMEGDYQAKPSLPFSPGFSGTGRISRLGPGVSDFEVGDRVLVFPEHGAFATKVCLPAKYCFPLPAGVPFEIGAALGLAYQTAWFALTQRAELKAGGTVLVLGATGSVGMAAVQLAKALGAGLVLATARGDEGVQCAQEIGADLVMNVSKGNVREDLRAFVRAGTRRQGVDVVIDPVGGDLTAAAVRSLDWCGRLVVVGFASGEIPTFRGGHLLVRNISVSGLQWTDYRDRRHGLVGLAQQRIFELWEEGKISPRISRRFPLASFGSALAAVRDGPARGRIILLAEQE
jgi:NADPH:quinone reductase